MQDSIKKHLLDAARQYSFALLVLLVVILLTTTCGAVAYIAWNSSKATNATTFKTLGPSIKQLEGLGELVSLRVRVSDVLVAEGEGYRGSWLIKGDALLSCDLSKATISNRDDERLTATIRLPLPKVLSPRVDHEKTQTWSVEKSTWIPWKWGNSDVMRDSAMHHAQKLIEKSAASEEPIAFAKAQAELSIRKAYEMVHWNVSVEWEK